MPCHSPTKARVIFSLTRAVPSGAMEMVSLKSVTRQLRTWAVAGANNSARGQSKTKGVTPGNTGRHRGELAGGLHDDLGWRDRCRSMPRISPRLVRDRRQRFRRTVFA